MTASVLSRPDAQAKRERSTTITAWTMTDADVPAAWAADLVIEDPAEQTRPAFPTYCAA
ncbi:MULTISPECIES: hypothetical protein [Nonomuraea]|jgi:hypothetical protein|uniref:Uncharacterized protein n=1 Tax=Nonomuraea salmonea TaxID=46181 RepID=A0ABV5NW65_9ACTN